MSESSSLESPNRAPIWIVDDGVTADTLERLGEGRLIADCLKLNVGVLIVSSVAPESKLLIAHGADEVVHVDVAAAGISTIRSVILDRLAPLEPLLILLQYERFGRSLAARLAVHTGLTLISPALSVQVRHDEIVAMALDTSGRRARKVVVSPDRPAIATFRAGVAEAQFPDASRTGRFETVAGATLPESIHVEQRIPADPTSTDIRHLERLIAGGRGLGDKSGFDLLRKIADKLYAGVAASRMAVDLGWIEYERQVGQTGKMVKPELYMACGISGASHHLYGMSDSKHIIAINIDKQAPIFRIADLGCVADLHDVLCQLDKSLDGNEYTD